MVVQARGCSARGGACGSASAQARGSPAGGPGGPSEAPEGLSESSEGTEGLSEAGGDGASTSFCNDPTAEPPPATTPGGGGEGTRRGRGGEGGTVTHSLTCRLTTVICCKPGSKLKLNSEKTLFNHLLQKIGLCTVFVQLLEQKVDGRQSGMQSTFVLILINIIWAKIYKNNFCTEK